MQTVVCLYRCLMVIADSVVLNCLLFGMYVKYTEESRSSVQCNHLAANTFNLFKIANKYLIKIKIYLADRLTIHVNQGTEHRYKPQVIAVSYPAFAVPGYNITMLLHYIN